MENKVEVELRSVYGRELIYPVNDTAKLFAELTGQSTLLKHNLEIIKKLGYEIVVAQAKLDI